MLSGKSPDFDQSLTVAQYVLQMIEKRTRADSVVRPVPLGVALTYSLLLLLGGVGGGFSVSSGEPAHTTFGPSTGMRC